MTIHHHPNDELLLDYASGALREGWSLAIAAHLALCPQCRRTTSDLEALGGGMLMAAQPAETDERSLEAVLSRLDVMGEDEDTTTKPRRDREPADAAAQFILPQPLRDYVGGDANALDWRRLGRGAYQVLIPIGEDGIKARLLRIPAGRPVPEHSHRGMELTLVLAGAFADSTGSYARGDFQEADESLEHQPHAAPGEDCICLAVTDAPLRFSSIVARLAQPFLGI